MWNFKHKKSGKVVAGGLDGCMPKLPKRLANSIYFESTEEPVTHRYDESAANHADEDDDSFLTGALVGLAVGEVIGAMEDNNTPSFDTPSDPTSDPVEFGGGDGGGGGATDSW
jgi:hypothetical protein